MDPNSQLVFLGSSGSAAPSSTEWILSNAVNSNENFNDIIVDNTSGKIFVGGNKFTTQWFPALRTISSTGTEIENLVGTDVNAYAIYGQAFVGDYIYLLDRRGIQRRDKATYTTTIDYNYSDTLTGYGAVYNPTYANVVYSNYNYLTSYDASGNYQWSISNPSGYYFYTPVHDVYTNLLYVAIWGYVSSTNYICYSTVNGSTGDLASTFIGFSGYRTTCMTTDNAGKFYIGGNSTDGSNEAFVVRANGTGSADWAKVTSSTVGNKVGAAQGLAVDTVGDGLYIVTDNGFIIKYTASSGLKEWSRGGFGTFTNQGRPIKVVGNYVYACSNRCIIKFKTTTTLPVGTYGNITITDPVGNVSNNTVTGSFTTTTLAETPASKTSSPRTQTYNAGTALTYASLV